MKKPLSPVQEDIVNTSGNIIVKASAGTGKTHTMVTKIEKDIADNKSHKVIAAITFTIRAAGEIRDRLPAISEDHFIGTNNSFAIEEIIKPFMKDVYGRDYDKEMGTDYEVKVEDFDEGIDEIKESGIIASLKDNKENFIFKLALDIVKNSFACREFLKAKYFNIYVDEYQDCDKDMHAFFMYLCDELEINTFVVGDAKQSIYMWRGAYPKAFESIWEKPNFEKKFMGENFRSCEAIQNYSNMLCKETRSFVRDIDDASAIRLVCTNLRDWPIDILNEIDLSKKTAVLRYSNDNARVAAELLSDDTNEFIYVPTPPIASITTNTAWLYTAIASFFIIKTYSVYDIIQVIPDEAVGYKSLKKNIQAHLDKISETLDAKDEEVFMNKVKSLADYLGYETKDIHLKKLYKTIVDENNHYYFLQDSIQNISMTFHSSKGLEFDQVVLFAEDYNLYYPDSIYNHYVAATRAKERLIIVYLGESKDQNFYRNLSNKIADMNKKTEDFMKIIIKDKASNE